MVARHFYRLSDLATRWGCTTDDLLHLGIQDRAQLCVNVYGMSEGTERQRMDTDPPIGVDPADEPQTDDERRQAEAHDAAFERWKARTTRNMPAGIFELTHDTLRFIEMPSAFPYELEEALKFDEGWWEVVFDPPVVIGPEHLCMLDEEVQRLDREVFGHKASEPLQATADAHLRPRAETTYLNIIGALVELVTTPRPGRDSDAAVIRELIENYSEKPGISRATLEKKFAAARRSLKMP